MSPHNGLVCKVCGTQNPAGTQFCTSCGSFLEWNAEPAEPASRPPGEAEERTRPAPEDRPPDVKLDADVVHVVPGSTATLTVTVGNRSHIVDRLVITVDGPRWVMPEPSAVSVWPGNDATVSVEIRPPIQSDVLAGPTRVTLFVQNEQRPALRAAVVVTVEIAPFEAIEARIVPQSSSGARGASHRLEVTNEGNAPFKAMVTGRDPDELLRIVPSPASIDVPPGTRGTAVVRVRPHRMRLFGRPRTHPFKLRLEPPTGPDRVLDGTHLQTALLSLWIVLALGALVLAAGAFAVVNWPDGTDKPTATPSVTPSVSPGETTPPPSQDTPGPSGCVVTVEFDFVQLHESPSPSSRVIASVPKGDYEVTDIEEIDWAGQTQQWFEITAEGRTGWVRDDPIFAGQKSAECP